MTIAIRAHLFLIAAILVPSAVHAQINWSGATSGAWLTGTNWTGGVPAGNATVTTNTDIAGFINDTQTTVGINMNTTSGVYYLGAIDRTTTNAARTINNSSTTVGGVLTLNGATVNSVANTIIRNSSTGLLTITNGTSSGTLGLALAGSSNIIQLTGTGGITIGSNISGSNGITRQGGGAGTLTLSGNNSYTGVTSTNGAMILGHNNALGSTAIGSNTTVAATGTISGGRIGLNSGINTAENITITGLTETGGGFNPALYTASGTATFSGTITLAGTGGIRIGANTTNWTGTITQSTTTHGLVFQGTNAVSNAMTINGANLTILQGTTTLNSASGTGIGSTTLDQNGVLRLGVTDAIRTDRDLSFGTTNTNRFNLSGLNQTVRGLSSSGGSNTRTVNNDTSSSTSTLTVGNGGGDYSFNGTIINNTTGTGLVALVKTGLGNQTLVSTNTYTGGTRIDGGTLTLGNSTNTLSDTGAVNVNGGTLALGTNSDTVGAVTLTSGSITSSTGVLTGSSYAVESGSVSAILGGSGIALTKTTGGTVTLTGVNTYTGATSVNGGTLVVNGSLAAGSAVSVGASGTLGGTGTISGPVTILGAHTPGTSPGIQTFGGNLTYSGGNSTVQWELVENTTTNPANPNADYDQIIVAGNLDFDGATSLSLVFNGAGSNVLWANSFWDNDQQWTLYDVAGSTTDFGNLSLAAGSYLDSGSNTLASARPSASFSLVQSGQDVLISYVAVPEPTTLAILGASVAFVGLTVARRRKA